MTQYISKAAVVAEIKRLSAYLDTLHEQRIIEKILLIIDTLEVKEISVDVGSPEGDWSSKTVQFIDADGNIKEITFNKAQKGE